MTRRRRALAVIGSALAGGVAGCTGVLSSGDGDGGGGGAASELPEPEEPSFDGPAWASAGGGPRNRGQAVGGTGPEDGAELAWSQPVRGVSKYGPTVAGNTVFHGDVGVLTALAAADGSVRWANEPTVADTPTFADGSLYAPDEEAGLVAVDPASGETTWEYGESGAFEPATVTADGLLYALSVDGQVLALDAESREEQWHTDAVGVNAIGVADSVVYARGGPGLAAFVDGEFEWQAPLPSGAELPVVGDENVFARSDASGGTVYAVARGSGGEQWTYEGGGDSATPSIAFADGRVAFAAGSTLALVDAATGDPLWEQPVEQAAGVAAGGETVYATFGTGDVAAFDAADGTERWRVSADVDTTTPGVGQPVVVGDRVYAPLGETIAAVDPA